MENYFPGGYTGMQPRYRSSPGRPSTKPETAQEVDQVTERLRKLLPPYKVLLHNDDHNDMTYVVQSIIKAVPQITPDRAVQIMVEAHTTGVGLVIVCPKEPAELYRDRLGTFGLTSTIEPDR